MPIFQYFRDRWRLWAILSSLAVGVAIGLAGAGTTGERAINEMGWALHPQPASGKLHIVEIDARSIAAIDRWPWPRRNHAQLIDQLRAAGVASIAFDVDFSSRSASADDIDLASALVRAKGQVILPTFRQSGGSRGGWVDSLPIASLRDHSIAAAVSVQADTDGFVRRAPVGTVTEGLPRPSLSAMIAGHAGSAGQDFPINFAIDPASIPRHSFIDIRDGRFDRASLAGKNVVVGATAVEMGDRYVVPVHGVIPGVVLQSLAAETLMAGVPREAGWPVGLIVAALVGWFVIGRRSTQALVVAGVAAPIVLIALKFVAQLGLNWSVEIVPALVSVFLTAIAAAVMQIAAAARRRLLYDLETGLPNRRALEAALRGRGQGALVAAHIVEFDKIGAALGTDVVAELIVRLRDRVTHLQTTQTIYRIEDRVLCWAYEGDGDLDERMIEIRSAMLHPLELRGRRVDVTFVLGYAQGETSDPSQLIANAALAAERARSTGSAWHVHQASDGEAADLELSLLGELDEAIAAGQIEVLYQPKLDLSKGAIVSVEALVRWHHPTRGFLRPDVFIPLAERSDRIAGLTLHVLEQTLTDLAHWQRAGHSITGAINVSAKLLGSAAFGKELRRSLGRAFVEPDRLVLEVTESAAMNDPETAAAALRSFCELGVAISMDDYGTGQCTLSYLRQLPLSELKIDRSFVQHVHENAGDAVLVRSTVRLAHELGLKVVAEGVEDADCLAYLRSIGCDLAQGYLISRPVPAGEILHLLEGRAAQAA
jgi:EAL domain-containing protein (putative c-di-GMP-specific phosphodiesterase class I)/CHASE2 domain-containing sensor protein